MGFRFRLPPITVWGAWGAVAIGAAGCVSSPTGIWPTGRRVELADFARPVSAPEPAKGGVNDPLAAPAPAEPDAAFPEPWVGPEDLRPVLVPVQTGVPVLVESLVGQINGKPVFADRFLEPLEDRLLRTAEETSGRELDRRFRQIIFDSLKEVVRSELMLAEAEATLTEQQRMGLFALLDRMYQEQLRMGGGTVSGAEQRARRSGSGLQEYMGTQKEVVLIRNLISEQIAPLVIVSWRDVEREYRRRYDEFNPAATVTLARIRLDRASQAAQIEDVTRRLEAGEPFAKIAEELGVPDGGRWEAFTMGPGGITDIGVSQDIKRALEGLEEGQTSKPVVMGGSTIWVHVAAVSRPEARSLYDPEVQLMLVRRVRDARYGVEFERYVASLQAQGIFDDLDRMADRLYTIAVLRYGR
jgi:hypothetical protein